MPPPSTEDSLEELKRLYKDLSSARTKYDQGMIRARIREIERLLEETPLERVSDPKQERVVLDIENSVKEENNTYFLSDASHQKIALSRCYESAQIHRINSVSLLNLHVHTSCHIFESQDSCIYLIANQVRLTSCKNMTVYAYTRTGVYVENSSNITLLPYEVDFPPFWSNHLSLYDFNQPQAL